jgi:acetylornithine deacetylase/succinyl-diaminopimelate desuccinylase-like protein
VRTLASLLTVIVAVAFLATPTQAEEPSASQATEWLESYLKIDSTTVDGSLEAGTLLREILHQAGVTTQWIVSPQGQPFLYAKTEAATPDSPSLMLLHHLDVVPAEGDWVHPPFAAHVEDGNLYGRGAIDDKSLGIAHLVSFLRYRNAVTEPSRSLIFLAVGGEEDGGLEGTGWLLDNHPELFENLAGVLTEGGSNRVYGEQIAWWGIEVAQKRPLWMRVTASGRGGHGSAMNLHSAPHRLVRGLGRLVDRPLDFRLTPEVRLFLEKLAPLESPAFRQVIENLDSILAGPDPVLKMLPGLPNYLSDSLQVNVLDAGTDLNVTPSKAEALIDARLLPDTDEEALLADLRNLLGKELEIEVLLSAPPSSPSPTDHAIFRCLETALGRSAPVVPAFISAITDARFLRQEGIPVYGFSPFVLGPKPLRGIHADNEHIPLVDFEWGVENLWNVVSKCATS